MSSEFGTGKTIFVLAIVVGCFAILWPKVFYPMLTASMGQTPAPKPGLSWKDPATTYFLTQLCYLVEELEAPPGPQTVQRRSDQECLQYLSQLCIIRITEPLIESYRLGKDSTNLTSCITSKYGLTYQKISSTSLPKIKQRHYQPHIPHPQARSERPAHLHPEMMHPALREKGRVLPQRTSEKETLSGPRPGMRPPMGGAGGVVPPQTKGSGAMGIIMPIYTVGIVVFFIYTIMKVLFKKEKCDEETSPKLKDFHMDPEYRKYVFAEEYLDSTNALHREHIRRQEREYSRGRRKSSLDQFDSNIEDEQMDQLRRRLEDTEKAMERLMSQMGSVTDKLTAAKITEVLTQAQAQAKMLKNAEVSLGNKGPSSEMGNCELPNKGC